MSDADELPEGWASCSVLDLCHAVRGVSYSKGEASRTPEKGLVPIVRANNIDGELTFEDLQFVPQARVSKDQRLRVGDVVIAMSSGSKSVVGKAASVTKPWTGAFGAFCGVLRPCSEIEARHFGLFFQTVAYRKTISGASAGTNINNLKREHFAAISFPIPPLAEQQRIVAKVEALLARVNAARQRLAKAPAILKRFRQSVLAAACSGRLTADWRTQHECDVKAHLLDWMRRHPERQIVYGLPETLDVQLPELPEEWTWSGVEEVASAEPRSMQSGPFGSNLLHSEFQDDGVLAIGIDNVLDGRFSMGREHRISLKKFEELRKYEARPSDVLITVMATVGRVCVIPVNLEPAIITKHVYRITVDKELVNPFYLALALRDDSMVQPQIKRHIIGQTRPGINGRILKYIQIPLPTPAEQREIVRRVEALFKLADAIEKRVAAATVRAERLTQAILAKAFRGELVPTEAELARREGRDYEPASVLLERIKSSTDCTDSTDLKKRKKR